MANQKEILKLLILCLALRCTDSACPELSHPEGGIVSIQGNRAAYTCRVGLYVNGNNYRDCINDAWTGTKPSCDVVVCDAPEPFANGIITTPGNNGYVYNETIVYECSTGYRLIGEATRTCAWDGLFSGTAPTCEILTCAAVSNPSNGQVSAPGGNVYNSVATYTCNVGYVVTGSTSTTISVRCTVNGWETASVTCSVNTEFCPFLTEFPTVSRVMNAVVSLSCSQDGYIVDGATSLTCQTDGSWSSSIPTCVIYDCGNLPAISISTGFYNLTSGTTYGSVASYYCNEGHTLSTNSYQRTCTITGWSGADIQCNIYSCISRSNPINGEVQLSNQNFYGSTAEYLCNTGYELIGDATYDCTINGWTPSNSSPFCRIYNCGALQNPSNGRVDTSGGTTYGATATYTCNTGYTASTSTTTECLANGQWSITGLTCNIVACPSVPSIQNAEVDISSSTYGAVATFTCVQGYVASGTSTTTCQANGQWTTFDLTCTLHECVRLSQPPNVFMALSNGTKYDSVVTFNCEIGYTLIGSNNKVCTMSGWQPTETPYCQIQNCGALQNPSNGIIDTSGGTTYGAIATYTCNTGHIASTSTQTECLSNGQWSITGLTCNPVDCGSSLINPADGTIDIISSTYGGQAQYRCTTTGYVGSGTSISTCQANGQWSTVDFQCTRHQCTPGLTDPNNGQVIYTDSLFFASQASFTCNTGYQIISATTHSCTLNGWEPPQRSTYCQIYDCGTLQNPSNGRVDISGGTSYGAIATYTCNTGHIASTSTQTECLSNGQWSITGLTCNPVVCPDTLVRPTDGTIDIISSTYGGQAQYRCTTTGYVGSGTSISTCQANGQWSTVDFQCIRHQCTPGLTDPNNGQVIYTDSLFFASQASFTCNTGYQIISATTHSCTLNGWEPPQRSTYCQIYDCGTLQNPSNGRVDISGGTSYGAIATYSCNTGYIASTNSRSECLANGQWSLTGFTCNIVACPGLPSTQNAVVDTSTNTYGAVATYSCVLGYVASGTSTITCQANGQWTAFNFTCTLHECVRLSQPPNVFMALSNGTKYDSVVTFNCEIGYTLIGSNNKVCTMLGWQPTETPYCQIKNCGALQNPSNGIVDTSGGTTYGAIATYTCNTGHIASTSTQTECLSNGQWSITGLTCNPVDCGSFLIYPADGTIDIISSTYGGQAQYRCTTIGYVGSGTSISTCQANGQWSTVDFQCNRHQCTPALTDPNNGRISYTDSSFFLSKATYLCNTGYQVISATTHNCTLGGWQPAQQSTYCQIYDCGIPQAPSSGSVSYTGGTKYNAVAEYNCATGYFTNDATERLCLDGGQWSGTVPTCSPVNCFDPPNLQFGDLIYSGGTTYGQTVRYECQEGYVFTGNDYIICQANGLWSSGSRSCDRYECLPRSTNPDNGFMTQTVGNYYGSIVEYRCVDGYQLIGNSVQNCTMTGWVPSQIPYCQILDCGTPPSISFGNVDYSGGTQYGTTARYTCITGYVAISGNSELQCSRLGSWSGSPLQCTPVDCGQPNYLPFGNIISIGSTTYRSTVSYECIEGYVLEGSNTTTCQANGFWSTEARACNLYNCGQRSDPINGVVDLSEGTLYGATATYSCNYGYERIGTVSQNCTMLGWYPYQTPVCQIYDCGQPPQPVNGFVSINGTEFGAVAAYRCATGYNIIAGNTERVCDHHGVWTGVAVECSIVQCGTPPFPLNGYATRTDVTSFQGTVRYECNEGYILQGNNYTTCQADGQWRPDPPICRRQECANLPALANGEVTRTDSNYFTSIATYRCYTGYQLVGGSSRNCTLNGWFPAQAPYCQVADCGVPPSGENVQVVYGGETTYGSVVQYSCVTGYTGILANTQIICGPTGQWSFIDLQCRPVDCGTPVIPNSDSYRNLEYNLQGTTYGSVVDFSCSTGYQIDGRSRLTCLASGQWSANVPMCRVVDCGVLPNTIQNGEVQQFGTTYGVSATYTCYLGYQLGNGLTSRSITCGANGNWDGIITDCYPVDCGNLTAPINGQISVPSTTYLEIAAYTCNLGHDLVGYNHRQCQADATWNRVPPTCVPFDCGNLTAPAFGNVRTPNGTTYGMMAIYTCDLGYHATAGNLIRTCFNGSQWDGSPPVCTLHDCGDVPNVISNGVVSSSGTTYGSTATFVCESGFTITEGVTQMTLTCDADGYWSDNIPSCVPIDCGSLVTPLHANITITGSTFNSVARYSCALGYRLLGNEQRVCQTNGRWSGSDPSCQLIVCSNLTSPEHGVVNVLDGYLLGHVAMYSCQTGYYLQGNVNRTCQQDGQWSGLPPTCQIHDCGPLPQTISNGNVLYTGNQYGDEYVYMCDPTHYILMNGQAESTYTITCSETGRWSEIPALVCNYIDCGQLPAPANGAVLTVSGNVYGSQALYVCNDGYQLIGNDISVCQANSRWNGTMPFCQILDCGQLPGLLYGEMIVAGTTFGQIVTYRCNTGYRLVSGSSTRMCTASGQWNGTQPVCELLDCGELEQPVHGSVFTPTGTRYGSNARYTCEKGYYRISGNDLRTCTDNGWDGLPMQCTIFDCLTPPSTNNGIVTYQEGTTYGTTAFYTCNLGYYISAGSERIFCGEGDWNGTTPICTPYECASLPSPANGIVAVSMTFYGERADYRCNEGYYISQGDGTRMCLNNSNIWNGTEPTCTMYICGFLPLDLDNGDALATGIGYQDTVVYTCYRGYLIQGTSSRSYTVTCTGTGDWSSPPPICSAINCGQPGELVHGRVTVSGTGFGAMAQYFCNVGYRMNGTSSILCQEDGAWSSNVPECLVYDCGDLPEIEHGFVDIDRTTFQGRALYGCDTGFYISSGSDVRICQDGGIWSGTQPVCMKYDCGLLSTSLLNGEAFQSGTKYGDTTVYSCNAGYHIEGLSASAVTVECTAAGEWSRTFAPTCVPIDCGPLTSPEHGFVRLEAGTGYLDVATYVCETGYKLEGRRMLICLENGEWSSSMPECQIHDCGQLQSPNNGFIRLDNGLSTYGSTAEYVCNPGYTISQGSEERRCTSDGTWDGTQPTCVEVTSLACGLMDEDVGILALLPSYISRTDFTYLKNTFKGIVDKADIESRRTLLGLLVLDNDDMSFPPDAFTSRQDMKYYIDQASWPPNYVSYSLSEGLLSTSLLNSYRRPGFPLHLIVIMHAEIPVNIDDISAAMSIKQDGTKITMISVKANNVEALEELASSPVHVHIPSSYRELQSVPSTMYEHTHCNCGVLPDLENGSILLPDGTYFLDEAVYSCNPGYVLSQTDMATRQCQFNGQWDKTAPVCVIQDCGFLPSPDNGLVVTTGSTLGSMANYTCRDGYVLGGAESRMCDSTGNWNPPLQMLPTQCVLIDCGPLPTPLNGNVALTGTRYNSVARFVCSSGYHLEGTRDLRCTETGSWSAPVPACYPDNCGLPNANVLVMVEVPQTMNEAEFEHTKTILKYLAKKTPINSGQSNFGFMYFNDEIIQSKYLIPGGLPGFNETIQFIDSLVFFPSLVPSNVSRGLEAMYSLFESRPSSPQFNKDNKAILIADQLTEQDLIMLERAAGLGIEVKVAKSVESGVTPPVNAWIYQSYTSLVQIIQSHYQQSFCNCGIPSQLSNGNLDVKTGTYYLDIVHYSCNVGYQLQGLDSQVCGADGTWEGDVPSCKPINAVDCGSVETPEHGSSSKTGTGVGSYVSFQCDTGYQLMGVVRIVCLENGSWSDQEPTCAQTGCGDLSTSTNVRVDLLMGTGVGSNARFYCDEGYWLTGSQFALCLEAGFWQFEFGEPPQCTLYDCGMPPSINQGFVFVTETTYGNQANYTCMAGYSLVGSATKICDNSGRWSPQNTPTCMVNDCPVIPDLEHGNIQYSAGNQVGSIATFTCDAGYQLTGPMLIICNTTGQWNDRIPTCEAKDCGPIPSIPNSRMTTIGGTTFGASVEFTCNMGYSLFGTAVITCGAEGKWSTAFPTCLVTDCGSLPNPEHGTVSASTTTFGQVAQYMCDPGYTMSGVGSRICQLNGNWSGQAPNCTAKDCGFHDGPLNGFVTFPDGTTYGKTALYNCSMGYVLSGRATRECGTSGQWVGDMPTCMPQDCGSLPFIQNGYVVSSTSTAVGAVIMYACNNGYNLQGSNLVTCQANGQWSTPPVCTLADCGILTNPANGSVFISRDSSSLQMALYRCDTGFMLVGDEIRSCGDQGVWTGTPPTCVRTDCGIPESPSNGRVTYSSSTVGSSAFYTCNVGFQIDGTANRLCQSSGAWSGTSPSCVQRACPSIQAPTNGRVELSAGSAYGSVAMFYCDPLYELVGSSSIVCLADGNWSGSPPTCVIGGTIDAIPVNLELNMTLPSNVDFQNETTRELYEQELRNSLLGVFRSHMGGDVADIVIVNLERGSLIVDFTLMMQTSLPVVREFSEALQTIADHSQPVVIFNTDTYPSSMQVQNTYVPVGPSSPNMSEMLCIVRQMMDGPCELGYICVVNNMEPTCQPDPNTDCGTPLSPTNGGVETPDGTKYGAPVIYRCLTGYSLQGQSLGTCGPNGRWEPSRPICTVTDCGSLLDPVNGDVVVIGTQYLNTATYSCNPGYSLIGTARVNCQADGQWSAAPPTCTFILCGNLPHPNNGNVTLSPDGQSAIYTCKVGYRLVGNRVRTCPQSGQWQDSAPTCQVVSCGMLTNPAYGLVDVSSGSSYGHTATYSCVGVEYELIGPSVRTCTEDGSWSGTTPACSLRDCGLLATFRNGEMDVTGTKYGDTASFKCNTGYTLHGTRVLNCLETGWDNTQPICLHVGDCGGLSHPANGRVIVNNGTSIGAQVTYECNPGYILVGDTSRLCLGDSTWSGAQPYCSIQECPVLMNPAGGTLRLSGDRVFGQTATITCDTGYKIEGPASIICQVDGTWSGALGCTIKDCGTLTNPQNGLVDLVMGTSYGAQAQYMCNPGYILTGTSMRTCGTTELWSLTPPTCEPKDCGQLMDPVMGTVTLDGGSTYGHIATYVCNLGYQLTGQDQRQCGADGAWTDSPPQCIIMECGAITDPVNGQVVVTQGSFFGSVASYSCNQGYRLTGQNTNRTCLGNQQWSGVAPTCDKVDCGTIRDPLFGRMSLSSGTTFNSRATYTCSTGYTLASGSSGERICLHNGTWSGTMPSCVVVDCGSPPRPSNGKVAAPEGTAYGRVATYTCDSNYDLDGPKTRTCQADGYWSENSPDCEMGNNFKLALGLGVGLSGFFILILVIILVAVICYRRNHRRDRTDRKYGSRSRIMEYNTPVPTVSYGVPVKMRQPKPVVMPVGPQVVMDDTVSVYTEHKPRYKTYYYDNLPQDEYLNQNYSYFRPSI